MNSYGAVLGGRRRACACRTRRLYTQKLATGKRVNSFGAVLGGCRRVCGLPHSSLGLNCHRGSVVGAALLYAALPGMYSTGGPLAFALRVSPRDKALRLSGAGRGARADVCWAVHVWFFSFFFSRARKSRSPKSTRRTAFTHTFSNFRSIGNL